MFQGRYVPDLLIYIAHVAAWKLYNLRYLGQISCVGSVPDPVQHLITVRLRYRSSAVDRDLSDISDMCYI